jgi:uncharacterized membrane protein
MKPAKSSEPGGVVRKSVQIDLPRDEVYRFMRNVENLAFVEHIESIRAEDEVRSHWVAQGPAAKRLEWDATVTRDVPGELIEWEPIGDSEVLRGGWIAFGPGEGGRGTMVEVGIGYHEPAGIVGAALPNVLGDYPDKVVEKDLRQIKERLESGRRVGHA